MNNDLNKKDISISQENDLYQQSGLVVSGRSEIFFATKRAEKIATAVYLVSGVLPEHDPLRNTIRRDVLDMLSFIAEMGAGYSASYPVAVRDAARVLVGHIEHIRALLEMAFFAGAMSEMNFSILKNELDSFAAYVREKGQSIFQNLSLTESFFITEKGQQAAAGIKDISSIQNKGHNTSFAGVHTKKVIISNQSVRKTGSGSDRRGAVDNSNEGSSRKSVRRERVLDIVRKSGPLTIKDISRQIKDCSEKTIQRELVDLVKDNVVVRTGERRWSMYSAA